MNCLTCIYCNPEIEEHSQFCDGYVRFGCKLNEYTNWTDTDKTDDKLICVEYTENE